MKNLNEKKIQFLFLLLLFCIAQNDRSLNEPEELFELKDLPKTKFKLSDFIKLESFQFIELTLKNEKLIDNQLKMRKIYMISPNESTFKFDDNLNKYINSSLTEEINNNGINGINLKFKIFNNFPDPIFFNIILIENTTKLIFNSSIHTKYFPNRLSFGEKKILVSIIGISANEKVTLPYNLPIQLNQPVIDLIPTRNNKNMMSKTTNFSKPPFDFLYWNIKNVNYVIFPWVPFFSNCEGYGRKLMWFDLLERHLNIENCTLKSPENTIFVKSIPTSGLEPESDFCNLNIKCSYEENVNQSFSTDTKWWNIVENRPIYYISTSGMFPDEYFDLVENLSDGEELSLERNLKNFIPVYFESDGYITNYHPTQIDLIIKYYQIDKYHKKLVSVNIILKEFKKTSEESFPYSYILNVKYKGMGYFELINAFQFEIGIYIFFFIIISAGSIVGILLFWIFNKLIAKKENQPLLKFIETFSTVFIPQIFGTFIGTIPFFSAILIVYLIYQSNSFNSVTNTYDPDILTDSQEIQNIKVGRLGLMIFVVAILFLCLGSCLMISMPSMDEEKNIINYLKKKKKENLQKTAMSNSSSENSSEDNSENSKSSISNSEEEQIKMKSSTNNQIDSESENGNENEGDFENVKKKRKISKQHKSLKPINEENDNNNEYKIRDMLTRKRYHYIFCTLSFGLIFIYFFELSYKPAFSQLQSLFILGFILFQAILVSFLQKHFLKERLLISPIVGVFEIIQFITVMASETFGDFIISYLTRLGLLIGLRTYVDPILKNINYFMNKFGLWLKVKHPFFEKILKNKLKIPKRDEKIDFYLGSVIGKEENQKLTDEDTMLEPVLTILLSYTSMTQSAFIRPFIIILIRIFPEETKIPTLYGFEVVDLDKYLLFSFVCIFSQLVIDIFTLNSLESLHGFKLYDYFSYCNYRYRNRKVKWVPHNFNLDRSIQIEFRSLDNLCFSTQFYFINSIVIYGICLVSIGISIMLRTNYNMFAEPSFFPIFLFFSILIWVTKTIFIFVLSYFFNIWKIAVKKERPYLQSIDHYLNSGDFKIDSIMEADLFRKHFIQYNKDWIINNFKFIIKSENFEDNDSYLLNLYQILKNKEIQEQKEQKKINILKAKQKIHFKNNDESLNSPEDLKDEKIYNNEENIIKIPKSIMDNIKKIIEIWLYNAKEINYLRKLVQDILKKKKEDICKHCKMDVELNVIEKLPYIQLLKDFRIRFAGLPFLKDEWKRFYEKTQKFITLCSECEINYKKRNKRKMFNFDKKMILKNMNKKKIQDKESKDPFEIILLKWRFLAMSSLLHKNIENQIDFEKET